MKPAFDDPRGVPRAAFLCLLLVAGSAVPGCIGFSAESDPAGSAQSSRDSGGAVADTSGTWYWMNGTSTPEGRLSVFEWVVPDDAIVEERGRQGLALELLPMTASTDQDSPDMSEWGILAFKVDGDEAVLVSMLLSPTLNTATFAIPPSSGGRLPADLGPVFFFLDQDAFDFKGYSFGRSDAPFSAGDRIRLLVFARSESPGDFDIIFRPLDRILTNSLEAPEVTKEALVEAVSRLDSRSLALVGNGSGFHLAVYAELSDSLYLMPIKADPGTVWTDNVRISSVVPEIAGSSPDVRLETETDLSGYSISTAYLDSTINGAGKWSADVDLHGQHYFAGSVYAMPALWGGVAWKTAFGVPGYDMIGQGNGGAKSALRFTETDPELLGADQWFVQVTVAGDMAELLGVSETPVFSRMHSGLLASPDLPA